MLAFETIILLLSAILLLLGPHKKFSPSSIILTVFAVYIVHFILGNPRWQFVPLYAVMFLGSISFALNVNNTWTKRILITSGIIGVLLSLVLNYLLPLFTLPATNGSYKVSAITNNLDDLSYKLWYPLSTQPEVKKKTSYYADQDDISIMGMPKILFSHLKCVKTNAYEARSFEADKKFPLILYSHGASSIMVDNTALMEEIASHGYIVVAVQHNFSFEKYDIDINDAKKVDATIQKRLIDSLLVKAVPQQVNDYNQVLNSLQKLPYAKWIDFSNIGVIGHSLGGATVTSVPATTANIKAVVNIDGPIQKNIIQQYEPSFLYISSFSPDLSDHELKDFRVSPDFYRAVKHYELQNVKKFFETNTQNTSWVRFKTANHLDLTDMPFIIPLLRSRNYDRKVGHQLRGKIIVTFLNRYMKGTPKANHLENENIEWIKK